MQPRSGADPDTGPGEAGPSVTEATNPAAGCHYFSPGARFLSKPQIITALWPVSKLYCVVTAVRRCDEQPGPTESLRSNAPSGSRTRDR